MRIIDRDELSQSPEIYEEIASVLEADGVVCFPTSTSYRLATRMMSEQAVIHFMQIKRRTKKAPALIFVPDEEALGEIVAEIPDAARRLMDAFWPGPLTMQFELNPDLPRKLLRNLNVKGKVGIRIPQDPVPAAILEYFPEPLLISSANIARKKGAHSEAQIRKNFGRWIDILISQGDLRGDGQSTVLDVTCDPPALRRAGSVDGEEVLRVWSSAPGGLTPPEPGFLEAALSG